MRPNLGNVGGALLRLPLVVITSLVSAVSFMAIDANAMSGNPPPETIVYTRQPNNQSAYSDTQGTVDEASNWQRTSDDAGRPLGPTSEFDLVTQPLGREVTVIHPCTNVTEVCGATYGRVNPAGTHIIYTVFRGNELWPVKVWDGPFTDMTEFPVTSAELWLYEIATKRRTRLTSGAVDTAADWVNNTRIAFTTNRSRTFPAWGLYGDQPTGWYEMPGWHVYQADLVGTTLVGFKDLTPHEQFAMSVAVLTTGDICYSSWQGYGDRGRGHSAPRNMWWIVCMRQDGSGTWVELGAHGSPTLKTVANLQGVVDPVRNGEGSTHFKVLRAVAEIGPGVLVTSHYYNGQSLREAGSIIKWAYTPETPEGATRSSEIAQAQDPSDLPGSGQYTPATTEIITPPGTDQDSGGPRFHKNGRALGRFGYGAPWVIGGPYRFIATWHRGWCSNDAKLLPVTMAAMGGEHTCKPEIVGVKVDRLTDPFDPAQLKVLACGGPRWACWGARVVARYEDLYGIPQPVQQRSKLSGNVCRLGVVNGLMTDLNYIPGAADVAKVQKQGNIVPDYPARVARFRVEAVEPYMSAPPVPNTAQPWEFPATGQRVYKSRRVVVEQPFLSDGSGLFTVPCETPLLMSGIGGAGKVIAHDQMLHSLRVGETRLCHGCHDGHSEERAKVFGRSAEERFKDTMAAKASPL